MVNEQFIQSLWQYQKIDLSAFKTLQGEKIKIIEPGLLNKDAGPDFFNARLKIGGTTWAGNVEMHIKSSDWNAHGHQENPAYNNVILHLVLEHDQAVFTADQREIPTALIRYDEKILENYTRVVNNKHEIPCGDPKQGLDDFSLFHWLTKLAIERLENKSSDIMQRLGQNKGNWEETFYQLLARNFGLKTNAEPFERLARSLPLKYLAKHKGNLLQIEAMLFGQAGFLHADQARDAYHQSLEREYQFLRHKFSLSPLPGHVWKFLRLRPVNFPTIRIAQFASLVHKSSALSSKILEAKKPGELVKLFSVAASSYWDKHYTFGKTTVKRKKNLGKPTVHNILINTVAPYLFTYGNYKSIQQFKDKGLQLLEELPPEKNHIIQLWNEYGIKAENSLQSQALIQLKNTYCQHKKCLDCHIGHRVIMENAGNP